jgi:thiamine monophosphate kinase
MLAVFAMLALVGRASAREYGPGDVSYLMNLWNSDRARYEGTVQGIDTFSALGTVQAISPSGNASALDVIIDIGLSARVSCAADTAAFEKGETVMVSGRIGTAATALSQMKTAKPDGDGPETRARDTLELRSCTVRKALRPKQQ